MDIPTMKIDEEHILADKGDIKKILNKLDKIEKMLQEILEKLHSCD